MKERPILFSASMVRAILEGRKTQTRRVVKPPKWSDADEIFFIGNDSIAVPDDDHADHFIDCPYGKPGDRLWVRETFQAFETCPPSGIKEVAYRADGKGFGEYADDEIMWKPSIHMPRWASRILLEITAVRVERLQDISSADCIAEGCSGGRGSIPYYPYSATEKEHYHWLWDSINGAGSWDANPWVWVVEFKVLKP